MHDSFPKRVVYLTAGAAGMYCGSCMADNALAKAFIEQGIDCLLVPVYTPIRVDGEDVSQSRVFLGGVNVYLDQKLPLYGKLPAWMTRWLDTPWLLRSLTRRAGGIDAAELGELTHSMLEGREGRQRREVDELCHWLSASAHPDVVVFTNLLIGGCIPEIQHRLQVPVVVMLQGDDLFLDYLPEAFRDRCLNQLRSLAAKVDRFVTYTEFYANKMSKLLQVAREKFSVIPLGIDLEPYASVVQRTTKDQAPRIGYLARLAPEKGLHCLVDAFIALCRDSRFAAVEFHIAGWLGEQHRGYAEQQWAKMRMAGLENRFAYHGSPDQAGKLKFLQEVDVLSVPTTMEEPKGIFVLEALAAGVPVVLPNHGAFPELLERLGGGKLVPVGDISALTEALGQLLSVPKQAIEIGEQARIAVQSQRSIQRSASEFLGILRSLKQGA